MPDPAPVPARASAPLPGRRSILAASLASPLLCLPVGAARRVAQAALIVPLSGPRAAIGRSMARAAALAQGADPKALLILDDGGDAAAAARTAIKQGAGLILGPLQGDAVPAVLAAAAGRVPVVAFSNDHGLREGGALLFGITADQSVATVLRYARGRGIRRVAVIAGDDPWGRQVADAARTLLPREGLTVAAGPAEADAALLSSADPARRPNCQLLLAPAGEIDGDALRGLEGAWLASPDPATFQGFAAAFEAANGSPPGLIAGLAYDAAAMAVTLRKGGALDRSAVLAAGGFEGVCGAFRFRDDGSAVRMLAVLAIQQGNYQVIQHAARSVA